MPDDRLQSTFATVIRLLVKSQNYSDLASVDHLLKDACGDNLCIPERPLVVVELVDHYGYPYA